MMPWHYFALIILPFFFASLPLCVFALSCLSMKVCDYCGLENDDDAVVCSECGTTEFWHPETATFAGEGPAPFASQAGPAQTSTPPSEFRDPTPEEMKQDLVTLLTCPTIAEADLVVSELTVVGIDAFIPDETMSQTFAPYTFGAVRVQVAPSDYELAKAFLSAPPEQGQEPDQKGTAEAPPA
ncbi:MAG: hypothetical protein C5B50_07755 [Verrucomicrobia bacterium]|nr:MAG: hypothetical protein C5B50_07755 [Verrucomicrobiota bacterium]